MATTLMILPVQVSQEGEGRWEPQASVLSGFLMCLGVFPENVILRVLTLIVRHPGIIF